MHGTRAFEVNPPDHMPDRRSVRMTLPPLPVAGLPKPIAVKINLDAGVTEQMIDRLTVLRMQMLPKPSPVRKQN